MSTFWPLWKILFFLGFKKILFYLKYPKMIFSDIFSEKNSDKRNLDFSTKSMDETRSKMSIFWPFLKVLFFPLKIILFFPQYQKRCFLIEFLWKTPIRQTSIFAHNPWTNPFKKCPFFSSCENLNFLVLKWLFAI